MRHSMIARISPAFTVAPATAARLVTRPARTAFISFCIFMASITMRPWPASTGSPCETSESAQRFSLETLTAVSLEAVHEYAAALDLLSKGQLEEAAKNFSKAVDLD